MTATNQTQKQPEIQFHELTSTATDAEIEFLLTAFDRIFPAVQDDPTDHGSLSTWRQRLTIKNANVFFARNTANANNEALGFFFNFPKTHEQLGFETLHIWLAGVVEEARGLGIFPMLMQRTLEHARKCGYDYVTVATIPGKFPKMYKILSGNGWEVIAWSESVFGPKVTMKLKV